MRRREGDHDLSKAERYTKRRSTFSFQKKKKNYFLTQTRNSFIFSFDRPKNKKKNQPNDGD